jgi:predicted phosphodiesterase
LHLSDLHIQTGDTRLTSATLHTDLQRHFRIGRLDYLVISGDIADRARAEEYNRAAEFVDGLVKLFSLTPDRVVVVPGNHDVDWDKGDEAFIHVPKRRLRETLDARVIDLGDKGVLICDESKYKERFTSFSQHFFRKIFSEPYDLDYEKQFRLWKSDQDRIVFLGLNTCWEIDEHQPEKAGIHPAALAGALSALNAGKFEGWLKIAVWHHPIGVGSLDDSFLSLLAQHGFQIAMQGHRHKARHQLDVSDSIHILEGGTFSAHEKEQTPGVAMQYSLLSYDPIKFKIRIDARKQQNSLSAWMSDLRYRTGDREVAYKMIRLKRPSKGIASGG